MITDHDDGPECDVPFDALAINLDRDHVRLDAIMATCAAVGIQAERLPALTPATLPDHMRPWFHTSDGRPRGHLIPGEIGCYASHLLAMEIVVARGRPVLVLEDDAVLAPEMRQLADMMVAAPDGWGFLQLSSPPKHMCLRVGQGSGFDIVTHWRTQNTTTGYVVSPEGARRFLEDFSTRCRPVDEDLRREWLHGAAVYGVVPSPITSSAMVSSIDPEASRDQPGRRRAMGRMNGLGAWAWRLKHWGSLGVAACLGHSLLWSIRKRLGRRPGQEDLVMDPPFQRRG